MKARGKSVLGWWFAAKGENGRVVWYLPSVADTGAEQQSFLSLAPDWVLFAVVLLASPRERRLVLFGGIEQDANSRPRRGGYDIVRPRHPSNPLRTTL